MTPALTIPEILGRMEAKLAHLREQQQEHAREEERHRAERLRHEAELEELTRRHEAFRAAAAGAAEIAALVAPPDPEPAALHPRDRRLSGLVARAVAGFAREETFGTAAVTRAVNRQFGPALRRPADPRQVSIVLSRLAQRGSLRQVRRGRPHWEALYARPGEGEPPAG